MQNTGVGTEMHNAIYKVSTIIQIQSSNQPVSNLPAVLWYHISIRNSIKFCLNLVLSLQVKSF